MNSIKNVLERYKPVGAVKAHITIGAEYEDDGSWYRLCNANVVYYDRLEQPLAPIRYDEYVEKVQYQLKEAVASTYGEIDGGLYDYAIDSSKMGDGEYASPFDGLDVEL